MWGFPLKQGPRGGAFELPSPLPHLGGVGLDNDIDMIYRAHLLDGVAVLLDKVSTKCPGLPSPPYVVALACGFPLPLQGGPGYFSGARGRLCVFSP